MDPLDKAPGKAPLGKSVEEIEQASGNRVNPDTPREQLAETPLPPIPVLGGASETSIAAGGSSGVLLDGEEGADTTRRDRGAGDEGAGSDQS